MDQACERFRGLVGELAQLDPATLAPHATADRDAALAHVLLLDQIPRNLFRPDVDAEALGRVCFRCVRLVATG